MKVSYFHPITDSQGKRLSTANIIWAERDRGNSYYRFSRYVMRDGNFPSDHPCAPFDQVSPPSSQCGSSKALDAFRSRGYWASCFPEGDGITLKWWSDVSEPSEKTAEEVMRDIEECFGWEVVIERQ